MIYLDDEIIIEFLKMSGWKWMKQPVIPKKNKVMMSQKNDQPCVHRYPNFETYSSNIVQSPPVSRESWDVVF